LHGELCPTCRTHKHMDFACHIKLKWISFIELLYSACQKHASCNFNDLKQTNWHHHTKNTYKYWCRYHLRHTLLWSKSFILIPSID
jgi:hypothetical protein